MVKYKRAMEDQFAALGDPSRFSMVTHLSKAGELSVSELASSLSISLPGTLKHVRILESSKVVTCRKEGRVRYCSLNAETLENMIKWLLFHQQFWSKSFDCLESHFSRR